MSDDEGPLIYEPRDDTFMVFYFNDGSSKTHIKDEQVKQLARRYSLEDHFEALEIDVSQPSTRREYQPLLSQLPKLPSVAFLKEGRLFDEMPPVTLSGGRSADLSAKAAEKEATDEINRILEDFAKVAAEDMEIDDEIRREESFSGNLEQQHNRRTWRSLSKDESAE